jgi:hypothetical protein
MILRRDPQVRMPYRVTSTFRSTQHDEYGDREDEGADCVAYPMSRLEVLRLIREHAPWDEVRDRGTSLWLHTRDRDYDTRTTTDRYLVVRAFDPDEIARLTEIVLPKKIRDPRARRRRRRAR